MHIQQMWLKNAFSLSTTLMHAQPLYLQKASMYNLYNPILLLWRHLIVAGKTQPTAENIGSYVLKSA